MIIGIKLDPGHWLFGWGLYIETGKRWNLSMFEYGHVMMPGLVISWTGIDVRFLGNAVMYQWRHGFKVRRICTSFRK